MAVRKKPPNRRLSPAITIDLDAHHSRCEITEETHAVQRQCARVTLDRAKRVSPFALKLNCAAPPAPGSASPRGELRWQSATDKEKRTHASRTISVERGAEAIALLAALDAPEDVCKIIAAAVRDPSFASSGLTVTGRAMDGTGADWLFDSASAPEKLLRLEVSGTESKSPREIQRRLREKCAQLLNAPSRDPGLAVVVAFATDPVEIHIEVVLPMQSKPKVTK